MATTLRDRLCGHIVQTETYANAAQASLGQGQSAATPQANPGKVLALQSWIAVFGRQDYQKAIELASAALGENQAYWRVTALWTMAEAQVGLSRQ